MYAMVPWKVALDGLEKQWKHAIFSNGMNIVIKPKKEVKVWRKKSGKLHGYCLGYPN